MAGYYDDLLKFQHAVDQRATGLAEDMVRELRAARADIVGKLAALADDAGDNFADMPLSRKKALLEAQAAAIDKVLAQVYATAGDQLHEAGQDVIQSSATQTAAAMSELTGGAAVGIGTAFTLDMTKAWFESSTVEGLTINDFLGKLKTSARDRIISAGRRAMIEGKGVQAAARMIRQEGIEGSVPGLEGLARTYLLSASNYARETIIEKKFSDVVAGWKRMAVLDGRTCVACGSMDGKIYKPGEPRPSLPAHWRCRCLYTVVTPTFRDLGIDIDEMADTGRTTVKHTGKTVQHKDGSTSTKFKVAEVDRTKPGENYTAWMKRQMEEDPAFVRRVLGKTRFELFKAGKLSLSGMVTEGKITKISEL